MKPNSEHAYTGRTITLITLLVGLAGAAAPAIAQMDLSSTAGVVAGIVALSAVVVKYLDGWQKYEARLDSLQRVSPAQAGEEEPASEPPIAGGMDTPAGAVDEEPSASPLGELELDDDEPADVPAPPTDEEIAAFAMADVGSLPTDEDDEASRADAQARDDLEDGPVAGIAG